jgi:hypothetical protein
LVIAALLLTTALVQGAEVTASVDRTKLTVGQQLTLTVRARTRSAEPVTIVLPPLTGFSISGSRELTEVAMSGGGGGGSIRTTIRELQLRAEQPGALLIGPVRARQGESSVSTDPILITVDSAADRVAAMLSPLARGLLERAPPPAVVRSDRVAVSLLVAEDTVFVGQQVDLVAAAWVPRELRERMRRAPLLTLVTPAGVWAYPAATGSGVAASRQVGGRWMDLFVAHQVVFPLATGRLLVPPATVEFAVPVTFSFFSREERYALRSDSLALTVLQLPPPGGTVPVAQRMAMNLQIDPANTRVGEPIDVAATITGVGNVALWSEPVLRWPTGFRVYPAQTEVRLAPENGLIAGSKTFHFFAVPDSAGSFVLPDVRYPYYDIAAGRYEAAVVAPRVLAVAPGAEPRAARALPPLLAPRGEPLLDGWARRLDLRGGVALALAPPIIVWLIRRRWRRRAAPASEALSSGPELTRLGRLEKEFLAVLASYVSDPEARDGDGLAQALRAAGVDSAVADHVKRLRDRLRAARYGPRGRGDVAELAAEIEQVLRVLGAEGPARRRRPILVSLLALAALALAARAGTAAQSPSAEALYEAGALRAAADSFAARTTREPRDAAHWYNLGATLYRAGADGKAAAAWTLALRLAPRDAVIRRARRLLPSPDPVTDQLLRVGWATPGEWAVISGGAWLLLWIAALSRQRQGILILGFAAIALGTGLFGAIEWRRRARPVAVVVAASAPIRSAPYGVASPTATLPAGGALIMGRRYGPWREIERADGVRGWVLASEIAPL